MLIASYVLLGVIVFFPTLMMVTYTISVTSKHVEPFWPCLSYTGNYPVESCIFTGTLNIVAAAYLLIVFLRYCQFIEEATEFNNADKLNRVSAYFGIQGAVGLSITGSFPQRIFNIVHIFGLSLCFVGTFTYMIFQTIFSYRSLSRVTKKTVKIIRLILLLIALCIHCMGVAILVIYLIKHPKYLHKHFIHGFQSKYTSLSNIFAILEWLLLATNLIFFGLFYNDFKRISLKSDQIIFKPFD